MKFITLNFLKINLRWLLILSIISISNLLYSQSQVQIKGVIVDEFDEPMIGVTILAKGTTIGTTTNLDGDFTLDVP